MLLNDKRFRTKRWDVIWEEENHEIKQVDLETDLDL
jgi:hypothetical protein